MQVVTVRGREWLIRDEDIRFTMRRQENSDLFSTEGYGGQSGAFNEQFTLAQSFWQDLGRWRDLFHRVHALASRNRRVTEPFMAYLNASLDCDDWIVLSRHDRLEVVDQTPDVVRLVPQSALFFYISGNGECCQVLNAGSQESVSGNFGRREFALERAAAAVSLRAEYETRMMLDLYYTRWRDEGGQENLCG